MIRLVKFYFHLPRLQRGFSFIEVMYSILLLAGVLVLLSELSTQSTKLLKKSEQYYLISHLMENKLTELELEHQTEGAAVLKDIEKEPFEKYPDFSWSLETQKMVRFDPAQLEAAAPAAPAEVQNQIEQLNEAFTKLVTEVRLTIYYTKNKVQPSYSITAYFIDFKEIQNPDFLSELRKNIKNLESFIGP